MSRTEEETERIRISIGNSREEGSCNACTDHTTSTGVQHHTVYTIHLRCLSFRLCLKCKNDLLKRLAL